MRTTPVHTASALAAGSLGLLLLLIATSPGCRSTTGLQSFDAGRRREPPRPVARPTRAMWVTRFQYRTPEDVRTIIANCAASGCNTVLWQVRGEGTVAYPSRLEPWSREFGFQHPGFDPLALAVAEAHRHGLRIEPWLNVMPGWKGPQPPPSNLDPPQLYAARPDWFLHDESGRQQPLGGFYVILNPCRPDVRRHIAGVIAELVSRYDIDGVHLDYVRYAWDGVEDARQRYPRDPQTLALYRRETGLHPDDDSLAWHDWRANQLTRLVVEIRRTVDRLRPGASVTAAVWRDPQRGYREYLQNSVAWLRAGLIDAAMPMAYTPDAGALEADILTYRRAAPSGHIVPGLGLYMHEQAWQTADQLRLCWRWGGDFALFSYESLFPAHGDRGARADRRKAWAAERSMRRRALEAALAGR